METSMDSTLTHANASPIIFTPGIDLPKTHASNMVECLRYLARVRPNDSALITVKASGEGHFSYQQLEDKVKGLAAILQQKFILGDRALILHDNDEHYVVSFLACLYAGIVAVPIFPPESMREKHLERLLAVAEDAQPVCLLTASTFLNLLGKNVPGLSQVHSIAVDQVESNLATPWQDYNPTNDDIAFLQYTSGSTAAPKGVMVSHGNLFANEIAMEKGFSVTQDDVFVSWLPLYHDMGLIGGLLQPLFIGIPVVLMSPTFFLEKPIRWLEAISHYRGTVSGGPDFSYRLCVERIKPKQMKALDLSCWRLAFSGAEPIRHDTLAQFSDKFSSNGFSENALCPCYGLAEATLYVAGTTRGQGMLAHQFCSQYLAKNIVQTNGDGEFLVSCGHTADEHQITIMAIDSKGEVNLLANEKIDEIGEIWVSGPSIAQGYWRNAEATAETFVEHNGKRWLRTGDLGFVYQQQLYITGRMKDLIILRGHNLYPQDIERAIEAECDFVRKGRVAAFSVTKPDGSEGIGLALEIPNSLKKLIPAATLFDALGETISAICREFMAVAVLLNPGALPKTSSGKLQRSACRSGWKNSTLDSYALFEFGRIVDQNADVNVNKNTSTKEFSPQDKTEVILAKIWAEVLNVESVDRNDNFFSLGGNSVRVLQVTANAEQAGIKIAPKTVFENPSIAALSKQINREQASLNYSEILPLTSEEKQQAELSFAQSRQWFLWQLSPESSAYHISGALNFSGSLDIAAVKTSFNRLVERHESLRTIFKAKGDGLAQQVIQSQLTLDIPFIDLTQRSVEEQYYAAKMQAHKWCKMPFDLTTGPLLRIGLIKLAADKHIMVLVIHHIIADGWSIQVLLKEFTKHYQATITDEKLVLPELKIQYADYAIWQRNWLKADELNKQLTYWQTHLGDKQPVLRMRTDKPRQMAAEYTQASHSWTLPSELSYKLRAVSSEYQATVFMTLLSAFQTLLYRYTGQEDLRVGIPAANRHRSEVAGVIGFFVNTQVLRGVVNGRMPLHKVLVQVKTAALGAQANQELPFEKLVEALHPERSLSHTPLFQVMHNHQQSDGYSLLSQMPGLEVCEYVLGGQSAQFELTLETIEAENGDISVRFNYAQELFEAETIMHMGKYYQRIVQAFTENIKQTIGDICLITDIEYKTLFTQGDNPTIYTHNLPVHQLIEQQVALTPKATALVFEDEQLTYLELNQRANQLAHYLITQGIKPEDKVGIAVERSVEMVVSLLAVLKAGGAYVPLDPDYPKDRLAYIMQDSNIKVLLCESKQLSQKEQLNNLPELTVGVTLCIDQLALAHEKVTNPAIKLHGDNLAYLIYTSGSTGKPKGVMVRHYALSNFLNSMQYAPGLTSDDTLVAVTSLSFDIAALELYLPLLSGAKLVLATRADVLEGHALSQLMEKSQATVFQSTPSGWRLMLASGWSPKGTQSEGTNLEGTKFEGTRLEDKKFKGLCGGEALPQDLAKELRSHGVELWNMYGPTETTIWSAVKQLNNNVPTLGKAVADTRLHILDNELNPTPQGVAGELYIGGAGLARGYAARADLTTLAFIANPFSDSGERLYRTGDLVCWNSEGELEYLGRIDHQVKIRGFRIELGEIETALLSQQEIHEAVIIAKESKSGAQLIAYVSINGESSLGVNQVKVDVNQIKAQLGTKLPDYMIPAVIIVLPELPKTPNGKVDRKALPDAQLTYVNQYEAPVGEVETQLAQIWSEVLDVEKVGRHDNFFTLGGDSILTLKVVAKAHEAQIKLTAKSLFEQQTIAELAQTVGDESVEFSEIIALNQKKRSPAKLSFAQNRQWFLWQLAPQSTAYHIAGVLNFSGLLDISALKTSFNSIVARHESLRTIFSANSDGSAEQVILEKVKLDIPVIDLTQLSGESQINAAKAQAQAWNDEPFNLTAPPLLRIGLIRLSETEMQMVLVIHHIISDGWSIQIIINEFVAHYLAQKNNTSLSLAKLPLQYIDYATWQHNWLEAGELDNQLSYWREQLGDEQPILQLPTDYARQIEANYSEAVHSFVLPMGLSREIKAIANQHQSTVFMVLLSAFQVLLYRYSNQEDIRIGVPIASRHRSEIADVIGLFVNTQVLRSQMNGQTPLGDVLKQAKLVTLGAQKHQDLPFEKLVEALQPQRSLSHTPLFQVMFNHQRRDIQALSSIEGLAIGIAELDDKSAQYELTLDTIETESGEISIRFSYAKELFKAETIAGIAEHYHRILTVLVENTEQAVGNISCLSKAEHKQLAQWGINETRYNNTPLVHQLIEQHAQIRPDSIALLFGNLRLTYKEFNQKANQLAHLLIQKGIKPEDKVGIAVERSLDMVIALLAVLKVGAAYVPLDPEYPEDRLVYMIADSGLSLVLTQSLLLNSLPLPENTNSLCLDTLNFDGVAEFNPDVAIHGDNLVYLIYTSGSTGKPKAVAVSHGALSMHVVSIGERYEMTPEDRELQFASINFDGAHERTWVPLAFGATLMPRDNEFWSVERTCDEIKKHGITIACFTPSYLHQIAELMGEQAQYLPIRSYTVGGEATSKGSFDLIQSVLKPPRIINGYGPTETVITPAIGVAYPGDKFSAAYMPIGKPVGDRNAYVLDQDLNLLSSGIAGELYFGNGGLARGYLGRADLTSTNFIADPFSEEGGRLYRTGDLVRWNNDGELEYLGRIDHQVKIRGFRIELGEIESELIKQIGVSDAVVVAHKTSNNEQLVAYISSNEESELDTAQLKNNLMQVLPNYMVPALVILLKSLPRTPNGKVDRKSLPEPEFTSGSPYESPEGEVELILASIWAEVLEVEKVGRNDNFFDLGGHSLKAMKVSALLNKRCGFEMPVRYLFEAPELKSLALLLPEQLSEQQNKKTARIAQMASLFEEFEI